jgi:hypothetical protein
VPAISSAGVGRDLVVIAEAVAALSLGFIASLACAQSMPSPNAAGQLPMSSSPTNNAHESTVGTAVTAQPEEDPSIWPFKFHASDEALADLRRRIVATKWPSRELVTDASQELQPSSVGTPFVSHVPGSC